MFLRPGSGGSHESDAESPIAATFPPSPLNATLLSAPAKKPVTPQVRHSSERRIAARRRDGGFAVTSTTPTWHCGCSSTILFKPSAPLSQRLLPADSGPPGLSIVHKNAHVELPPSAAHALLAASHRRAARDREAASRGCSGTDAHSSEGHGAGCVLLTTCRR